jgi:hypothetical protein
MKTILLHAAYTDQCSYFDDWVDAFKDHNVFNAECFNVCEKQNDPRYLKRGIEGAEIIILHHSMNGDTLKYLTPFISLLKDRKGKLISFVGNEVNLPTIGMAPKIKVLKDLDTDIIATQLLQEAGEWLYVDCLKSKVISIPHALNSKAFYSFNGYEKRKIDIGSRSARYGVYIGDNERNNIFQFFEDNARKYGLSVDLGLQDRQQRFNRQEWCQFLNSCKATISNEAASFYLERDDQLVKNIYNYLKSSSNKFVLSNETFLRKIYRCIIPNFVRKKIINLLKDKIIEIDRVDHDCNFLEIYEKFFSNIPKCPVYAKAISSRHFDAIGAKTLHVMYPGRYNDILIPQEHYFELKTDHSNIDELLDTIRNSNAVQKIVDRAYDYVIENHTHKKRLDHLAALVT